MPEEKPLKKGYSLRQIAKIMKCSKTQVARELKESQEKIDNNDEEFLEGLYGVLNELAIRRLGQ